MLTNRIADVFRVQRRFLRSVHLERDFADADALDGYVITPPVSQGFERLIAGLAPKSGHRAWRVTGDYGTGKSSFALALARLLCGGTYPVPQRLRKAVDFGRLGLETKPELLPVLVTGAREPLGTALLRAMANALEETCTRGKRPQEVERLRTAADACTRQLPSDALVIELVRDAVRYVRESDKASGILIILDEMGKFLEYASLYPERQDVYLLQGLAEAAARSGDAPLFVVGILHQGFQAYAERLSNTAQKEWEKVAGRYEEVLFNQPLEQTAALVADAINVRTDRLPRGSIGMLQRDMTKAVELGLYGAAASRTNLIEIASRLYPLHPTVVPALVKLFSRFGQNERSLFSFLLSDEPFSLQTFAAQSPAADRLYRIHQLYDYARATFGHRLIVQSYRNHWNQIESVVESFPHDQQFEISILKTVAVLNLIDVPALVATDEVIALAVGGTDIETVTKAKLALKNLQRGKAVLYFRGAAGGYCLWPHTSVNLDRAYQEAIKAVVVPDRVSTVIHNELETRPLVARRHYIETGNLRHFSVMYVQPDDLAGALSEVDPADGRLLIALCETEAERETALQFARSAVIKKRDDVLVAVPQPLSGLASLVAEVQRWEWITQNVPELNHDEFAMEEATRQRAACKQVLEKRVQGYIGLRQFGETTGLCWFHRGASLEVPNGRVLLTKLSNLCKTLYCLAPQIHNELVNRHMLSSAAAAARLRLIDRILCNSGEPLLGMDSEAKPPEMSMYLSVLKAAKLHREQKGKWELCEPAEADDPCTVRPVLRRILELLKNQSGARLRVTELFADLRRPPYGIRDGMGPLLLAVFAGLHERDVAFYEAGGFQRQMTGQEFQRLTKSPESWEVQYCRIDGLRAALFEKLYRVLHPDTEPTAQIDLLDVVRPLCVFAAQLPAYTQKTSALPAEALAVREVLLKAQEPASLIFRDLPIACQTDPFEAREKPSTSRVRRFVSRLREVLDFLRAAYPELLQTMYAAMAESFDRPEKDDQLRAVVADATDRVLVSVADPRLKAFCLRLVDRTLGKQEWMESLGSFVVSKPPAKWIDSDLTAFRDELGRLTRQFRRVEATMFATLPKGKLSTAMRVAITCQDGAEVEQVVYLDASEEARVSELEVAIVKILGKEKRLGVIAATRAILGKLRVEAPSGKSS